MLGRWDADTTRFLTEDECVGKPIRAAHCSPLLVHLSDGGRPLLPTPPGCCSWPLAPCSASRRGVLLPPCCAPCELTRI